MTKFKRRERRERHGQEPRAGASPPTGEGRAPPPAQSAWPAWTRHPVLCEALAVLVLAGLIAFMLWPFLTCPGWPHSHDQFAYPAMFDQFRAAFAHGEWYPRWLPDVAGGYGYPNFVFYQPLVFYLALPWSYLAPGPYAALSIMVVSTFVIGAAGAYLLGRALGGRLTAFFTAALWLLTPYLYVNLGVRGDLSELAAMHLTPWPLWALVCLERRLRVGAWPEGYTAAIAAGLAAVSLAHPATALFYFPVFTAVALYLAWLAPPGLRRKLLTRAALAILLGLVLSSPYWLTGLRMKPQVSVEGAASGYFTASYHAVNFAQLFSRFWGFGFSQPGTNDEMPFPLGLPHFLLALGGLACSFRVPLNAVRHSVCDCL